ncbi:hypothetical protein, partial [Butyricicoccus sp.]|uniref:hypothetical protein n=1 Tax=Butyricicoccus sp. TaxID=2049021 RepID=UPI003AABAF34
NNQLPAKHLSTLPAKFIRKTFCMQCKFFCMQTSVLFRRASPPEKYLRNAKGVAFRRLLEIGGFK